MVDWRLSKDKKTIGFQAVGNFPVGAEAPEDILEHVGSDDLLKYGFIPEMVGRLPVVVSLRELDKASLIEVLTEPKNAFVKQYQALFSIDNVDLAFTAGALEAAADEALQHGTGVRGLRSILEQTLLDVMYELPTLSGVTRCEVNRKAILGKQPVTLTTETGEAVPMPTREQKSA